MDYNIPTHAKFKKDIALRLAHKEQYKRIEREPQKQLDLLIVVDQMLTGFDSKWVNTLYMDKILEYENIIQAFSRTNRLFGPDKPFGVIRYYRKPHTMEQNVARAVKLYSGDKPIGLFVEKLSHNLEKMNSIFNDMSEVFKNANIPDFTRLPEEKAVKAKFASLFRDFNTYLEAAKVQGFKWSQEGIPGELIEQARAELHKTFAGLTQEEQKYANIFLHDTERGDVIPEPGKTLRDYITEYLYTAKDDQIHHFATAFGMDEEKLRDMMSLGLTEANINEFGRFDELRKSVDKEKAKKFLEAYEHTKLIPPKVNMKTDQLLRKFILSGGFEVNMPE